MFPEFSRSAPSLQRPNTYARCFFPVLFCRLKRGEQLNKLILLFRERGREAVGCWLDVDLITARSDTFAGRLTSSTAPEV